jgi:hypothetical protein
MCIPAVLLGGQIAPRIQGIPPHQVFVMRLELR